MVKARAGSPLPWNVDARERDRFFLILAFAMLVMLVAGVIIPLVDLPEKSREELEALPPQLARVVIEKRELPKPEIKKPEPKPEKKEEKKEEPKPKPEPKPEPKPQPKPEPKPERKVTPKAEQPKQQTVDQAREKAQSSGLLALSDQLSDMRALADTADASDQPLYTATPISKKASDKLVNNVSTSGSGGVDANKLDKSTQQVALASRKVTEVQEKAQPGGGGSTSKKTSGSGSGNQRSATRTLEEIRKVFDSAKGALASIHQRARRQDPTLKGTLVPELMVEANGSVSQCKIVESNLNNPDFEKKICARLRLLNFGAKSNASKQAIRYPIDLL
ncbi:AgmX/PglI C-terminal domain-containing protein [Hahella sp. CR1]|uniref:AgmX/PglI C-terminal domain-containing protein n=1 Tax=Hahella sp. CR1 TaxID=2992807 RepID=UPI002442FBDF|nr:AgmX/PglI C-terminal domain-containing protein [Hahella sp. CR1]MDG9667934.1 AgmX/PglI C-terminal domain-containing protein [Hahella sp. CR1]